MTTVNETLRWLFTAHYSDGSSFLQNEQDVSLRRAGGSAYTDVDHERLVGFALVNQELGDCLFLDLRDGVFAMNGIPFGTFDEDLPVTQRSLVFFRRHLRHAVATGDKVEEVGHRVTYHLGWKGILPDGTEVQRTVWVR